VNLKFIELDLEWPCELKVFDLRRYILLKLMEYGEPLRWSITAMTEQSDEQFQIISLEAVLIIKQDKLETNDN
tara:strand:- start:580 stop:798 length:219 start_codon:yes stop_codon:yes gene_type:complete